MKFFLLLFFCCYGGSIMALSLQSSAFSEAGTVPVKYTCDGGDISPPLSWSQPPVGTKSFALIMDDPDAPRGTWVHWVIYNIPASETGLTEAIVMQETLPNGTGQGINDFQRIGYGGPCPPKGPAHRYFFKLYALDTALALSPKATKQDLEHAMEGHVLANAQVMGKYGR
jgi:Raf kinase inhibitor-like YbhB/YbcL family protein